MEGYRDERGPYLFSESREADEETAGLEGDALAAADFESGVVVRFRLGGQAEGEREVAERSSRTNW